MQMKIRDGEVGDNRPTFVVAELSANHLQRFDVSVETVRAAKKAGADAIKFQTYTADTLTIDCRNRYFRIRQGSLWSGKTFYELYREACMPWEWQPKLMKIAEKEGLSCFSTPFDRTAVDFLEGMRVPCYKIASFEITDIPLIAYVASKRKPVILSTGIAALGDIERAVNACRKAGNDQIVLLKCTSEYPAPPAEMNLKTIPLLRAVFGLIVGISDHTLGTAVPVAAVALGAQIVEKHFILDRKLGGPDAAFSLEPEEFRAMVRSIREAEQAMGTGRYELTRGMMRSREFARSLFVVRDIKAGEVFTEENVRSIRPGYGLSPEYLGDFLGKKAKKNVARGTPLSWENLK